MTVELTSPVLGKDTGDTYTGTLEDWLLAAGYAKRAGYTGPGVSNTGLTQVAPGDDPRLPENRGDKAHWPAEAEADHNATVANDPDNLTETSFVNPDAPDFDADATDEDPTLPAADGDADGDGVHEVN